MSQQDLTGAYSADVPVVSLNTAAIIKYRAIYYNGTSAISIPLQKGIRRVILSLITAGNTISIGFGQVAGTITDSRFTFTVTTGPLDLSDFFASAPFGYYKAPSDNYAYLIIAGEIGKEISAAVADLKA